MKVALICPTVGQTRRGYERFFTDLATVLQDDAEITLFKGAGACQANERVVGHLRRTGILSVICKNRFQYPRYRLEFATFAAGLLPHLMRSTFDILHFIDPPLGSVLWALRSLTRKRFTLLFSNGGTIPFDCARWADHIHCFTPAAFSECEQQGVPRERLAMLPPGIDPQRFDQGLDRRELRRQLGIPENAFVILAVAALNRAHKRIDYLIEEVSQLSGNNLLWVDGSLHPDGDQNLIKMGATKLGERWRHTNVPSSQLGELFKAADVLVSAALHESFGLAVVEAASTGLPVVTHDSPHFRWLLGSGGIFVDMRSPGNLSARLTHLMSHRAELEGAVDSGDLVRRFSWTQLKHDYLAMYRRIAEQPRAPAAPKRAWGTGVTSWSQHRQQRKANNGYEHFHRAERAV